MKRLLMLSTGSYASTLSIRLRALAGYMGQSFEVTVVAPSADKYNNFTPDFTLKPRGYTLVQPWQFTTKSSVLNLIPYLFTGLVAVLASRADAVYIYKPTPITILGLVPRLWGRPVIVDMDDLGSEVMKLEGQPRLLVKLVELCERLALRYATHVVVTSTLLESMVRQKYPRKPLLRLPNGVEPQDYPAVPRRPLRNAVYYFGAINRLDLVEDMLRAAAYVVAQVPGVQFTIAGGGTALEAAQALVRTLGLEKSVVFTGWLDDMLAVQQYVSYGDVGICYQPDGRTNRAASNMKVFQYMAMRTVPVVSDVGDLADYVLHGKAGVVVPPENAEVLGAAIVDLLRDVTRRRQLTEQAAQLAADTYSWRHRTETLTKFINTAANRA